MNLGMGEIGLLIVLALVLFGAKRLPEVGRAAGDAIREFKSALNANASPGDDGDKPGSKEHGDEGVR
ncbi:MAG: twin-arginine translocase TatA/TatE family subunit [Synergistaceae bacterium]|jgi:sec-independent protein translocase protein TatA|nr:twin-arginine translocase TatA/TatE family subunit [Synergistaceae bacterium]